MKETLTTALFLFDAQRISREVSNSYGAWAEGELLKSLTEVLRPYGGWALFTRTALVCHGDMFSGEYPILCNWIRNGSYGRFRIDMTRIDADTPVASFKNLSQIIFVASNKNLYELIIAYLCLSLY